MKIGDAIEHIKRGGRAKRKNWNGKEQCIVLAHMQLCTTYDDIVLKDPCHENIGANFILFCGTSGYQCGWLASQADLLADDWELL